MNEARSSPKTRTFRFIASLTLALAAASAAVLTSTPAIAQSLPSAGSIGLRLVDVPAGDSGDPRARIYIVDHVVPGTVIDRRIQVANTTTDPAHIALYPAGAAIANGSF